MAYLAASYTPGAEQRTRDALAMARRAGDRAAVANVLTTCRLVHGGPDAPEERYKEALELAEIGEHERDARALGSAYEFLIQCHLERGDMAAVERELVALRHLGERTPNGYLLWLIPLLG